MSSVQGANGASSAIQQWQYLQSLTSTGSTSQPSTGSDPTATAFDPFAGIGGDPTQSFGGAAGPSQPFSLEAMTALIDAQAQASGTSGMSAQQQKVFGKLDADGDGSVSQSEIENAFGADNKQLADAVFAKLDKNGDGAVSASEFAAGTVREGRHHHKRPESADGQGGQDQLAQLLQAAGASSTSTSNSDGSSTTTITYADGSKVSMTTAASSSTDNSTNSGTSNSMQSNLLEQLIKLQAQLTSSATATSSTTA
jgi:EF-hand domain pair